MPKFFFLDKGYEGALGIPSSPATSGTVYKTRKVVRKVPKTASFYLLGTMPRIIGSLRLLGHFYPLCYMNTETDPHLLISGGHIEHW